MDFLRPYVFRGTLLLLLISVICMQCAEIGPPPGGEEDKIAPSIVFSFPENGAVNVPIGNQIEFQFSERIQKPKTTKKSVFISPRQKTEPAIKWKSDRLIINLADSFQTDQTYIATLSNSIKDMRNNSIDNTSTLAFTTGKTIDSGNVEGYIFSKDKPKANMLVCLYSPDDFIKDYMIDSVYPVYIVQSNISGYFRFDYLPLDEYTMIAFEDRNDNELIDIPEEIFSVPDRKIDLRENFSISDLNMQTTYDDTTRLEVRSASITGDNLIRVSLSKEIETNYSISLSVYSMEDSVLLFKSSDYMESYLDSSREFSFYYQGLDSGSYKLSFMTGMIGWVLNFDNFSLHTKEDKIKPAIKHHLPQFSKDFLDSTQIELFFSEILDSSRFTSETVSLWSDNSKLPLAPQWVSPFHVKFKTDQLEEGKSYKLLLTEFELSDLAGNVLGDSLMEFNFSIIDSDSLGQISGTIQTEESYGVFNKVIFFHKIGTNREYELVTFDNNFNIDLPSGKYLLSIYIDINDNNRYDLGSINPYQFSEPYYASPDTVMVRARFETSDIMINVK